MLKKEIFEIICMFCIIVICILRKLVKTKLIIHYSHFYYSQIWLEAKIFKIQTLKQMCPIMLQVLRGLKGCVSLYFVLASDIKKKSCREIHTKCTSWGPPVRDKFFFHFNLRMFQTFSYCSFLSSKNKNSFSYCSSCFSLYLLALE